MPAISIRTRLILFGIVLVLAQHLVHAVALHPEVFGAALVDTDAYLRLVRVTELWRDGAWFSPTLTRIGPPDGLVLHWTRPLDIVLLAGAIILTPFAGFEAGLHWWGVVLGPVLHLALVAVLVDTARGLVGRTWLWLAIPLAVVLPGIAGAFVPGRPDHHGLLLLLFVLHLRAGLRLLSADGGPRDVMVAALSGALGIWVGIEFAPAVGITFATMALAWVLGDDRQAAWLTRLAVALLMALAAALLLERGPAGLLDGDLDRPSIRHLTPFALFAAAWPTMMLGRGGASAAGRAGRAVRAFAALALVPLAMVWLDPGFLAGPMGAVDAQYAASHLSETAGRQSVLSLSGEARLDRVAALARAVAWLGIAPPALLWIALLIRREPATARAPRLHLGLGGLLFTGLAAAQIRWSGYAQVVLLPAYVGLAGHLLALLENRLSGAALVAVRPPLVLILLFWCLMPSLWIGVRPGDETGARTSGPVTAFEHCPLSRLAEHLADPAELGARPLTLLAFIDFGPELLYRTPHAVLAVPTHRPQSGLWTTLAVMTSRDDEAARRRLEAGGVDLVVVCPGLAERAMYRRMAGEGVPTLHERLLAGTPPNFLVALTNASGRPLVPPFRLYRLR